MTEYEIKLIGERVALERIFNRFATYPSVRDRHYSFNTYYLDYNQQLFDAGYSLRHRTGAIEIGKESGTELKATEGNIGLVSSRLEIGVRGLCPIVNYETLKHDAQYPINAPRLNAQALNIVYATGVRRQERRAPVWLNGRNMIIEAAFDDIGYLINKEKTGTGLYDCVLSQVKTEHELEFEILGAEDKDIPAFFNWVSENCINDVAVQVTSESKAIRAQRLVL